jgi:hypothetical protein
MQHLGVDVYVPRKVLPRARASLTSMQAIQLASTPQVAAPLPVATPAVARPAVPRPDITQVPVARKSPEIKPPVTKPAYAAAAVQFQLLHVPFSSGVLFVTDLRVAPLPPALEASVLQFLQALMFALGRGDAQPAVPAYFRWPLVSKPGVDNSETRAKDVLTGFVERQLRESKPQHLVLCGEQASRYIQPEGEVLVGTQVNIWRTVALGKVFGDPALKAELWRSLQALRRQ